MDNQLRISFICRIIGCRGLGYCLHISDIQLAWLPEIGETFLKDSFAKAPLAYSVTLAVLSLLLCLIAYLPLIEIDDYPSYAQELEEEDSQRGPGL